jgi:hypothetical protein
MLLSRLPILLTFSIVYSALKFLREVIQYTVMNMNACDLLSALIWVPAK